MIPGPAPITQTFESDSITIEYRSAGVGRAEDDLQKYLEKELGARILVEVVESNQWPVTTLFLAPAAVPLAKYAGKKLIDVLAALLRKWVQERPHIPEVVLYGPDGKIIKVSRR